MFLGEGENKTYFFPIHSKCLNEACEDLCLKSIGELNMSIWDDKEE